jgi:hypothetical protein
VAGCCEHSNDHSVSMEGVGFLDQLSDFRILLHGVSHLESININKNKVNCKGKGSSKFD